MNQRLSAHRVRFWTVTAFTISMLLLASLWVPFGMRGLDIAEKLGSVIGAALSVGSLIFSALAARFLYRQRSSYSHKGLQDARDDLVEAVRRQWLDEARLRSLRQPTPLRVTWTAIHNPMLVDPHILGFDQQSGLDESLALGGDLDDVAETFQGSRYRQMIILGAPGGGKTATAILVALDLISRRTTKAGGTDAAVPVVVSPTEWNPDTESFDRWIVGHISQMYPWLDFRDRNDGSVVERLLAGRHLLPIVDGLDEMPVRFQSSALDGIARFLTADQPLILTARKSEYEAAVAKSGAPLSGPIVIELQPPSVQDIAHFLTSGRFGLGWGPALQELRTNPHGPLAKAMATPLMVSLLRAQYDRQDADLSRVLAFQTQEQVQDHLLDAFVPTMYSPHAPAPRIDEGAQPRPVYDAKRAAQWLGYLALHLVTGKKEDLEWWDLSAAVPRGALVGLAALLGGGALGAMTAAISGPSVAAVAGVSVAMSFGLMAYLVEPMRLSPRLVVLRLHSPGVLVRSLLGAVPFGLAFAVAFAAVVAYVAGLAAAVMTAILTTNGLSVVLGLLRWLDASEEDAQAESPQSVLRSDRAAALANAGAFGAVVSVATAVPASTSLGPTRGMIAGLCVGMLGLAPVAVLFTAWGRFVVARIWLASRGLVPFDLIRFMDDAHNRGVLRQVGPTYRYRHILLRDRLAQQQLAAVTDISDGDGAGASR